MLAIFSANVVSHYPNLMVPILQFGAKRFWWLEFLVKLRICRKMIIRVSFRKIFSDQAGGSSDNENFMMNSVSENHEEIRLFYDWFISFKR